jgi:fimbrial chaperone protein
MNLFIILSLIPFLFSFKFNPMSQSLDLGDGKKSAQFTVENDTAESMAIELTVKERVMDSAGKETLPATTELSIFPPQIIIPSKEKRTIRVLWNGPATIEVEKSFRVVAEQLPLNVDKKKKGTGIQMLMKYMAAFYVTPDNAQAKIKASLLPSPDGKLTFNVQNEGNKHQIIYKPKMTLKKGSDKWTLTEKELTGFAGENVLAKSNRTFTIAYRNKIPSDAEVSLKLEE